MTSDVTVAAPDARQASASLTQMMRTLRPVLAGLDAAPDLRGAPLERLTMRAEVPGVASCLPLEAPGARAVPPAVSPVVDAFLDGIQRSRVVAHVHGAPLVFATVAAAIRERIDRRLLTWERPLVHRLLLASRVALGDARWEQLTESGAPLVDIDTAPDDGAVNAAAAWHPHAMRARALELVALEREQLERQLAAAWCAREARWLWIDGGVSGNLALDASTSAFGVVKSHNTLYGDAASVRAVLALREGERSPAFLVGHRPRRAVASWYLRWRAPVTHDPLFGLLRVEVSPPAALLDADCPPAVRDAFTAQCDRLSSGMLCERLPVSLPDHRWDTLAYGVHAVETYLHSLIGP
ncbi:hypothetical protein [Gemmatimonas sp.]|uniref:hypothetical protein n=1 Tax=Gemmatimonas sp. TaxID=1962908 RepID=UPI003DA3E62A